MTELTAAQLEARYTELIQEEQARWLLWQDVMDNHPSKGAYINAVRATDRFIDAHPEIERPEGFDREAQSRYSELSSKHEALELQNHALRRELELAHNKVSADREGYGD